jgi:hypothetical protein
MAQKSFFPEFLSLPITLKEGLQMIKQHMHLLANSALITTVSPTSLN